MADRTVAVKLTLRNEGFVAGLREASKQAKDFNSAVLDGAHKNKAGLDQMSKGFATVGLAAGAAFVLAVKKFADFDQAMSNVRAATHETAGNMQALRDAALDAGAKTVFSATQAATAIENLAKAGVSTKDILGGGLKGALDLAAAGSLQVGDAAEIAATAMTQFGLSGKDVPHIADLLAAAAGKAQGEVSDMAMALKQGGLVAAQMGLSIEETTATLAAFASAGLIGSDAGTSLKTMLLKLANPSKDAAATMKDLGIAAYDTKGNFVGIAPLAEELKSKMSKLAPAQRDAALATIFGSDAIRAANVLYKNGAAGIADWTTKVNDQGYAAETAALKTDNLKGDIERLGGAFDTALIKGGSGANGVLRTLVQTLDDAVSGFSELPGWVQQGATALAGIIAVGGLSAAGLLKAVTAAGELKTAWQGLSKVGKGLTLAAGGVGLALLAAAAIYGAFSKKNAEAKQRVDDLRGTLDEQTGAITGNTRAYVSNQLAQNGLAEKAKAIGLSLSTVTDAALGNKTALDQVVGSLNAVIAAGTTTVNAGKSGMITTFSDSARAAQDLKQELTGMNSSLTDAQKKQILAAEGATENKSAHEIAAEAVKKANTAFQAEAQSLEDVISAMHRASSAALSLAGSEIAVQAAIGNATDAIKENGKTHDITTAKGRANKTALLDVADAANKQTDAMLKSGKSNISVAATAAGTQKSFIKLATQMGYTVPQAKAMAKALIDIPNVSREAKLKANKADLDAKLKAARTALADPKLTAEKKAKLKAEIAQLLAAKKTAQAAIDALHGKTVPITINTYKNTLETITHKDVGVRVGADGFFSSPAKSFANGKLPDQAMVAPGKGRGLVQWAEGETGGEAFIPLAPGKRGRSTKILAQVADQFGLGLVKSFASGGVLAGGKLVDPAYILKQLNIPFNPLAGINSGALTALNKANTAAAGARSYAGRVDDYEQSTKARVAVIQRAITVQNRYIATLRAQGASEAKIRKEQHDLISLQDQLYAAKGKVTAATKASNAADAVYKVRAAAAAKAAEIYKDAVAALVEQQKAAVEMAGQIASGLKGSSIGDLFAGAQSGQGILEGKQAQAAQLSKFSGLIDQLRKRKLSEDQISQILGEGAGKGSVIAQAILDGGQSLVDALNKAQKALDAQANLIGANSATAQYGVKVSGARAAGGYVAARSSYLVGENHAEVLTMGSQSGWITPDPGRFMASGSSGSTGVAIDYQRIAQAASAPDVRVFIGNEEITGRIQVVIDKNNRDLKRRVTQGGVR